MTSAADGRHTWLMFTFMVALFPVLIRLLTMSESLWNTEVFDALDFLIFALVIFVSSMSRAGCFGDNSTTWKMMMNVASMMFMVIFCVLFMFHLQWQSALNTISNTVLIIASAILAIWSILMCIAVHKKLSKPEELNQNYRPA